MQFAIEMQNITKRFGQIVANDHINIQVKYGQVHALLGENGAGKSTLMSILFGLYQPDEGTILINGNPVKILNPNIATDLNIGMVHQHFKLVENFTVLENIILGLESKGSRHGISRFFSNFKYLRREEARVALLKLIDQFKLNVDLDAKIEDISVGMQQRVEILKMLYRDAKFMIFDEPTAVLTPQEIIEFMDILRELSAEDRAIILITHKLNEIKQVADECTVIRRGKVIDTVDVKTTSVEEMAKLMVGKAVNFGVDKAERPTGETILEVHDLHVLNTRKIEAVKGVSFSVKRGEIVGIAGVDGNGQNELVEALTGLTGVHSGTVLYMNEDITKASVHDRIKKKIAHIPEDRHKYGLVLDYTLRENMVLLDYDDPRFSSRGVLKLGAIAEYATKVVEYFDVRTSSGIETIARSMSGGNQQKAIIGREIERDPQFLIAVQPTRGLDVGAISYIHKRLIEQRDEDKAVLLISLELDEILKLSDRVLVMYDGHIMADLVTKDTDEFEIGRLMAGIGGESK